MGGIPLAKLNEGPLFLIPKLSNFMLLKIRVLKGTIDLEIWP
jgi:hypothetical protein